MVFLTTVGCRTSRLSIIMIAERECTKGGVSFFTLFNKDAEIELEKRKKEFDLVK